MTLYGTKQDELIAKYQIDLDGRYSNNIPIGWLELLEELFVKLIEAGWDRKVAQIKEKFGGLRFYFDSDRKELHDIVDSFEVKSTKICYYCGKPAKVESEFGWISYRCEEHKKTSWRDFE